MEDVLKMDIFFFVTTIVVVLLGTLSVIALAYVVAILHGLRELVALAKREAQGIASDLGEIREDIKEGVHEVKTSVVGGFSAASKVAGAAVGSGAADTLTLLLESLLEARARKRGTRSRRKV